MVSKKFWDTLNAADKKALKDAAKEATVFQIKEWNKAEEDYLAQAKRRAAPSLRPTSPNSRRPWRRSTQCPEYASYKEWVDKINATK